MSEVEQRMTDALSDLESMLCGGEELDASLSECAAEYGFGADILRNRATRALGDLSTLAARRKIAAEQMDALHKTETAIDVYLTEQPEEPFPDWFRDRVGREPTKSESDEFTARLMSYLVKDLKFEI